MPNAMTDLLLFFDRPTEPCFMQKGDDKTTFELPDNYYPDKLKTAGAALAKKFSLDSNHIIKIKNIAIPNISYLMELPYHNQFSLFIPKHRRMAGKLIDIFMDVLDVEDLKSICSYCQLRINPSMFNYCLSVALLHRYYLHRYICS